MSYFRWILVKIQNKKFYANPLVGVAVTLRTDRQKLDTNVALHSSFFFCVGT